MGAARQYETRQHRAVGAWRARRFVRSRAAGDAGTEFRVKDFMYSKTTVFISACLGMLLFGVSLITLGSIATDLQAKFSLDPIATGTLFSILPFGILAGSLVFGPVCDRYGYKLLLICACVGMFAGFQGIAFAASLALLKI